jgi:hypothetical protein
MKLTKLSAAWLPEWTCRLMPAPSRSDAGTALQLIPGVRPTGLRRQSRLTDDGLPATDCRLEGCETPWRWGEGESYGPLACRLRTTGLEA